MIQHNGENVKEKIGTENNAGRDLYIHPLYPTFVFSPTF